MKLPVLKKVAVSDLSLYTRPINMKISPGINLIIGGNGIGKTTLINTILFALVGNATYERFDPKPNIVPLVDEDYFKGRIETKDQDRAKVTLTIGVEKHEIIVTRALYRPRILKLVVKSGSSKAQTWRGTPEELEVRYRKLLERTLEISKFEDFVFIVANLLLFGEERRTLAWDSDVQNRLLRLLFLPKSFDDEVSKYSYQFTHNDTLGRHKSEERKDIRQAIKTWLEDKAAKKDGSKDELGSETLEPREIELRLAELETEMGLIVEVIEQLTRSLETEVTELKSLNVEADHIELQRLPLSSQLVQLETDFYSNVYKKVPPEYVIILEGMIKHGVCQFCGTKDEALKRTGRKLKRDGECIICRSRVKHILKSDTNKLTDDLAEQINSLRAQLEKLVEAQSDSTGAQASAKAEIERLQEQLIEKAQKHRHLQTEILAIRSKYLMLTQEQSPDPDRDSWLETQHEKINELDSRIEEFYRKRDAAGKKLKDLNEKYVEVLHGVNENLTPLFSHFASRFLGTSCELVVSRRTRTRKPVGYMFPRFNDKERENIDQVSESQRFFIDQAFRMALISWFADSSHLPTFCIVETPEGSLDLVYERNVAEMYAEFGTHKHSIIATSNLNSSNFLVRLIKQLGNTTERRGRVVDLLHYGRLSRVQEQRKSDFNDRLSQLKLPLI
jgi:hypothetical protein